MVFVDTATIYTVCIGGKCCSREDPSKQKGQNAIQGLHSSWVSEEILAMARPWHQNVLRFDIVKAFQRENLGLIMNLQEVRFIHMPRLKSGEYRIEIVLIRH